jgi:hypothetical protein
MKIAAYRQERVETAQPVVVVAEHREEAGEAESRWRDELSDLISK